MGVHDFKAECPPSGKELFTRFTGRPVDNVPQSILRSYSHSTISARPPHGNHTGVVRYPCDFDAGAGTAR